MGKPENETAGENERQQHASHIFSPFSPAALSENLAASVPESSATGSNQDKVTTCDHRQLFLALGNVDAMYSGNPWQPMATQSLIRRSLSFNCSAASGASGCNHVTIRPQATRRNVSILVAILMSRLSRIVKICQGTLSPPAAI